MAQYAVLITYREILGKEPELAHLHTLLAKYQRKEVLFLLAKLNCLLGTWQNALDFDVDIKLTRILLSSYYGQIDKLRRASGGRVLFSRITLLYLAKQACIACGDTGTMMNDVAELKKWCPGWESNPHEEKSPEDFKSSASAIPPPGRLAPTKSSMYEGCAQCLGQCSRQCAGSAPGQ